MAESFQRGVTLAELLLVVALLAIVAGVSVQQAGPVLERRVDTAVDEVAAALRFARGEAVRTGAVHGVDFSAATMGGARRIRLFRIDGAQPTTAVYDVQHPLDKRVFAIAPASAPGMAGVALVQAGFYYKKGKDGVPQAFEWIAFDADGMPDYYPDPAGYASYSQAPYVSGVTIGGSGRTRQVLVDPVTGRVTTP